MRFGEGDPTIVTDYSLKEDHPGLEKVLGGNASIRQDVYTGGVLWADEGFKGLIYPPKAKPGEYAGYYTRQFNTIELNSTHYHMPVPETLLRWRDTAPEGFRFCPKINQEISHAHNLLPMIGFHNACSRLFEQLGNRLGPCFMQLPPHFSTQRMQELITFLDNSELQNLSVELRHESWFKGGTEFNQLCNHLYRNHMGLVITDTPGRRDVVHMRLTSRFAFVRFKAANIPELDRQRIDAWLLRTKTWFGKGLEAFYFFIHTSNKTDMPVLTQYFVRRLEEVCGIRIAPPVIGEIPDGLFRDRGKS